jgi:catechol 2,3-dioxygenase
MAMTSHDALPPSTSLGSVSLTVSDLDRSLAFYTERLGLTVHAREDGTSRLGAGGDDILVLVERRGARRVRGTTGLFHFAVLLPSREALALAFARLVDSRTPMQGAADHLVSEALYLADPDGNGIELYRDRPRDEWRWEDGEIAMATEPLDLDTLLEEGRAGTEGGGRLPAGTLLGHMHLHVARIAPAEHFYRDVLGFDRTCRFGPTASFLSAGGYHHHVAVNTWAGLDAPRPPEDAVGLREFVVRLPDSGEVERVTARVRAEGLSVEEGPAGPRVRDPSGNAVRLAFR